MSAPVMGKVTIGSTGPVNIWLGPGKTFEELEFWPENSPSDGHAINGYEFSRSPGKPSNYTKQVFYNASGVKVIEFDVIGGWGTDTINLNVIQASTSHPLGLVARS